MAKLFDIDIVGGPQGALDFITNLLQASTEYSIIGTDLKGKILSWNEGAHRIYGYKEQEVIGKMNSKKLHTKEDVKFKLPIKMMEIAKKEGKWGGQVTRVRKNGSEFAAQVVLTPQFDSKGKPIGFLLISKDPSEELFHLDQMNYRRSLVVESNIDAITTIDPTGIITDVNLQMEKITGYPRHELIGSPIVKYFLNPRNKEKSIPLVLKKRKLTKYKTILRGKTGTETSIFFIVSALQDANGKSQGILITARDITEQEQLEEKFQKILEATPDSMIMINRKCEIIFINNQTEILFGYEKKELLGQKIKKIIPDLFRVRHQGHREDYFSSSHVKPITLELSGLRMNGDHFSIEVSLSPLDHGEDKTILAAVRDITDRKNFEKMLQEKNKELENANFTKNRFLASMSHELRTPLNAIIGFTGTLLMKLPGPLNQEQEKQLNIVKRSAKHLLSLINDLLDLSKIESGKIDLKFEKVKCQSIIEEVVSTLAPMAESKGLSFKVKIPNKDIIINTDRRTLAQIVINLANNSIKFTEKGEVRIEVTKIIKKGAHFVLIRIIDTGVGIKKADQAKLFQAFEQISVPGMRGEGTGLGLHVSQKLATLIHSKIEFKSEYEKGSCFSILLPMVFE